ncbi:hypothetical protein [Chlamydia caviae]|uniref:Uncharacterized protein n=1 Tax=Chlamydia caviae (strain ATCC VR-813 / DSM 19441 / 03DC25 / GPIC) TaxID=227941 RepID=Q824F6_CHLCV|nr:hypothetical protein [Chlamydia caviae]AAP04947.1 conserved hypothetical protein [Chlamydia caviae GPIC]
MQIRFQTTEEFDEVIGRVFPSSCHMVFPRDDDGLWDTSYDWDLTHPFALKNSVLAAIPLIGSIMGLIKLFTVWSVSPYGESKVKIATYTITGLMELCGLGIVLLALKILYLFFKTICALFKNISFRNGGEQISSANLQNRSFQSAGLIFS